MLQCQIWCSALPRSTCSHSKRQWIGSRHLYWLQLWSDRGHGSFLLDHHPSLWLDFLISRYLLIFHFHFLLIAIACSPSRLHFLAAAPLARTLRSPSDCDAASLDFSLCCKQPIWGEWSSNCPRGQLPFCLYLKWHSKPKRTFLGQNLIYKIPSTSFVWLICQFRRDKRGVKNEFYK